MIFIEDQSIKVGSVVLPGLYKSLEIDGSAIVEDVKVEGVKKIPRQATGYEDHKIKLTIELENSVQKNRWDKLKMIQNLFKEPSAKKPKVYDFINQHTQIRGIGKVIFKKLSSNEHSKRQVIMCELEFVEYESIKVSAQKKTNSKNTKQKKKKKSKQSSKKKAMKKSASMPNTTKEYQEYLKHRGKSPSVDRKPKRMSGAIE